MMLSPAGVIMKLPAGVRILKVSAGGTGGNVITGDVITGEVITGLVIVGDEIDIKSFR